MPYSPDVTTRTVVGQYLNPNGNPAKGTISITPSSNVRDPYDYIILSQAIIFSLDNTGSFSIELPCTDNELLNPVNWHYTARTRVSGAAPTSFKFYLPLGDGSEVDISTLNFKPSTPGAQPASGSPPVRGPAGPQGDIGPIGPTGAIGPTGPTGPIGSYVHNQNTPASTWTINHNLGAFPQVSVIDSVGNNVVGETVWVDSSTMTVTFSSAFSGKAYVS